MKNLSVKFGMYLGVAALLCALLFATNLTSRKRAPVLLYQTYFCDGNTTSYSNSPFRLIIYLDIKACLVCNEDMDAWREFCSELKNRGGLVSVYAKRSDSTDVAWAMHLEGISDTTQVLEDTTVEALGWDELGTPVKMLLDGQCRMVNIAGFLGNRSQSKDFFDDMLEVVCGTDRAPNFSVASERG